MDLAAVAAVQLTCASETVVRAAARPNSAMKVSIFGWIRLSMIRYLRARQTEVSTWSGGAMGGAGAWLGLTCVTMKQGGTTRIVLCIIRYFFIIRYFVYVLLGSRSVKLRATPRISAEPHVHTHALV